MLGDKILTEGILTGSLDPVWCVGPIDEEASGMQIVISTVKIELSLTAIHKFQAIPVETGTIDPVIGSATFKTTAGHSELLVWRGFDEEEP